jgi:integrase/recombinase XerD
VLRESKAVSVSTTQYFVAVLRTFLRFCFVEGLVEVNLSQAALPATGRRRSALPGGISTADARAPLDSLDRRSALGRRGYAIIITVLRLGLRAHGCLGYVSFGGSDALGRYGAGAGGERYAQCNPLPGRVHLDLAGRSRHIAARSRSRAHPDHELGALARTKPDR